MKRSAVLMVGCAAGVWAAAFLTVARAAPQAGGPAPLVDYGRQIQPIIAKRCLECHSQDRRKGGLSLATYSDVLEGGRNGPVIRPGERRGQPDRPSPHRRGRAADAEGRGPADAGGDRADQALDRSGRARRRRRRARRRRRGKRRSRSSVRRSPPSGWRTWSSPLDRFVSAHLRRAADDANPPPLPTRSSRGASISTSGACCRRRTSCRPSSPIANPAKRAALVDDAARRQREVRGALDLVLERPAAQRGRRHVFLGDRRPQEHHGLAAARAHVQPSLRPVRHEAAQSDDACGSRRLPDRRELARRDERRRDAVDAGVAEHRAGLPRHQPEVQRVPRQLRQQVEAEGRVRARGLLLAGPEAADVSLRRGAEPVRRAGVPLSGSEPRAGVELARRSPRRRGGDLHRSAQRPAAADAGQPHLAASASAAASSPTPTRWTAGRGVRSCSTCSRATSSITATTSST